jgi:hypothetical protein
MHTYESWRKLTFDFRHQQSPTGGNPRICNEGEHKNIYIVGDTALTMDMKLIPMH